MTSKKENTNQETSACLKGDSCHWVIEPPNGPTSLGKCKKCGKEKEFRNSFEYNTWHGAKPVESKNNFDKKEDSSKSNKDPALPQPITAALNFFILLSYLTGTEEIFLLRILIS